MRIGPGLPLWLQNRQKQAGIAAKPFPGVLVCSIRFKLCISADQSPKSAATVLVIESERICPTGVAGFTERLVLGELGRSVVG